MSRRSLSQLSKGKSDMQASDCARKLCYLPLTAPQRARVSARQRAANNFLSPNNRNTDDHGIPQSSPESVGYMGEESFLRNPSVPPFVDDSAAETTSWAEKILHLTGATIPPSNMLVAALADLYFEHVYPHQPIVDRADLVKYQSSPLLLHAICVIGSSYGHPRASVSQLKAANSFYLKAKTLLDTEHEKDNLVTLKALCLLTCRSVRLPTHISLQSNWHWQGAAVRYAIHMGLHKETTYASREAAGCCRRIWWQLFNHDKMSSFCYGRPAAINIRETDVHKPSQADFPSYHPDNDIFIAKTELSIVLGRLADARYAASSSEAELNSIGDALKDWIQGLPAALQLYDGADRNPFRRVISELHILYFACLIIYLQALAKLDSSSGPSKETLEGCVDAASQIARLFEEVELRNEVTYLAPINNWYCLLAGVIQIRARATFPDKKASRTEELQAIKNVLKQMTACVPSSNLILKNLERCERVSRDLPDPFGIGSKHTTYPQLNKDDTVTVDTSTPKSPFGPSSGQTIEPFSQNAGVGVNGPIFTPIENWAFDDTFDFDFGDMRFDTSIAEEIISAPTDQSSFIS
ncbi:hypothetical protein PV10_01649 [Exophiala mesophila]|uniref:Xylanolytic transcriptional activator regulatory domain-containing protein n=1 Tax=Exophiala mesophila TaxID=212818 RepID=A0A0D1ZVF7_EXOME|nr:uncharacterized protein PV10_01649 [Exophiala mesophila]KIV97954.1 hypothetical protein PV10_01649 [Exophiala mesophila]